MKRILLIIVGILIINTGCSSEIDIEEVPVFNPRISTSEKYTYHGFYDGLYLNQYEQKVVDEGMLHFSQSYLIPTREYSFMRYPLRDTTPMNTYLEEHREEIKQFMVKKYEEQSYGAIKINVRDDRVFDYQFSANRSNRYALITFRYEIVGYEADVGLYENFYIDYDLLDTKNSGDEFDENIFYPDEDNDGSWYNTEVVEFRIKQYYLRELAKHYDEVAAINEYINSTGRYHHVDGEEKCSFHISGCQSIGNVEFKIYDGDEKLHILFAKNNMSVEEAAAYIEDNNYEVGFFVIPYISNEIYDEYDFLGHYGVNGTNNKSEVDSAPKQFLEDYVDMIVEDKNEIKKILDESELSIRTAWFYVRAGTRIPAEDTYGNWNYSISGVSMCFPYDEYSYLESEDLNYEIEKSRAEEGEVISTSKFIWGYENE